MAPAVDRTTFFEKYLTVCNCLGHDCPICIGSWSPKEPPFTFTHSTSCKGHTFHRDCIMKWLSQDGHNTCPTCRHVLFELPLEEQWQENYVEAYEDSEVIADEEMLDAGAEPVIYHIRSDPEVRSEQPTWEVTRTDIEAIVEDLWAKYWELTGEYRNKYRFSARAEEQRLWATHGPDPHDSGKIFQSTACLSIDWSMLNLVHWRFVGRMAKRITRVIRLMYVGDDGIQPETQFETDPFEKKAEVTWQSVERLEQIFAELAADTAIDSRNVESEFDADVVMGEAPEVDDSNDASDADDEMT